MNNEEHAYLAEVYEDSLRLDEVGDLTDFGAGMAYICAVLLGKKDKQKWIRLRKHK